MAEVTVSTVPDRVELKPWKESGAWVVTPYWDGVDRPEGAGWVLGNKRTAQRLVTALQAGVVYDVVEVLTDVDGKTYAHGKSKVMGRYMNADLRRLGY